MKNLSKFQVDKNESFIKGLITSHEFVVFFSRFTRLPRDVDSM